MSQAVKIAVVAQIVGDTPPVPALPLAPVIALPKLLTTHPADPTKPALFNGRKSDFPPVYDCLTYRLTQATPNKSFRPGLVRPGTPSVYKQGVEDFYLDCEAWTQTPDSGPLDAINARLDALFHEQAFPTTDGPVFYTERLLRETDLYDKTLKAWFSLSRYRLRLQYQS